MFQNVYRMYTECVCEFSCLTQILFLLSHLLNKRVYSPSAMSVFNISKDALTEVCLKYQLSQVALDNNHDIFYISNLRAVIVLHIQ